LTERPSLPVTFIDPYIFKTLANPAISLPLWD
jgi:hypothetical protein